MKKHISTIIALFAAGIVFTGTSCKKYLEIDPPRNKMAREAAYYDSASANLAVLGVYSDMLNNNTDFVAYQGRWGGLASDEMGFTTTSATIVPFYTNDLVSDNSELNSLWSNIYSHIYQVNSVIEGVESSTTLVPTAKPYLIAEAKFLRAFLFFYAVNNWGAVPLTLNTDYSVNARMPRTSVEDVYRQIIEDLDYASKNLWENYPTAERVRPDKAAARALLARVYLYQQNWQLAESNASSLLSSAEYRLSAIDQVFLKGSRETIFQFFPATSGLLYDTYDGSQYIPTSLTNTSPPIITIPVHLYYSFENNDQRRSKWIGSKPSAGPDMYFPFKYKVRRTTNGNQEYPIVLRLAEQYLIRAEARAHLGNLEGAAKDLDSVRVRAGLASLPTGMSQDALLRAIESERFHELFCEWGHRWYDLKRTGRADAVMSVEKPNTWQHTDVLWPIPLTQILNNNTLVQNEGYH